jgi:hypothetical protein
MLARIMKALRKLVLFGLAAVIGAVVLFLAYEKSITGYEIYRRCRPDGGIGHLEWVFGVRPADDEWKRC